MYVTLYVHYRSPPLTRPGAEQLAGKAVGANSFSFFPSAHAPFAPLIRTLILCVFLWLQINPQHYDCNHYHKVKVLTEVCIFMLG